MHDDWIYVIQSNCQRSQDSLVTSDTLLTAHTTGSSRSALSTTTSKVVSIHGSTGIQIGDHNVQNLEVALNEMLASIDNADASKEEREQAKNRLNAFLAHPLVSAAVGASLPIAFGLLS
ncbi:RIP homotypic interaction motif-containing protein [Pseudomonas sp. 58 R 12]|uniref:RIP homotypic interaction motif-containing protein n=1 Tax=Pseudomonas sp. 58 R 12 TaxID=1844107 RepID=UPI00081BD3B0|nr:RIP homotypic interaction motif-containing protein [Pseudomonas sp. 58 R 12]